MLGVGESVTLNGNRAVVINVFQDLHKIAEVSTVGDAGIRTGFGICHVNVCEKILRHRKNVGRFAVLVHMLSVRKHADAGQIQFFCEFVCLFDGIEDVTLFIVKRLNDDVNAVLFGVDRAHTEKAADLILMVCF